VDIEALLGKAVAGMDDALLKTVEANRKALQQFVDQGASLQEKQLKGAIANLEKMEDTFFVAVGKAVESAASVPLQGPWKQVLDSFQAKGSDSGTRATQTAKDLLEQAKDALRGGRASGAMATQAMLDGYAALVSGQRGTNRSRPARLFVIDRGARMSGEQNQCRRTKPCGDTVQVVDLQNNLGVRGCGRRTDVRTERVRPLRNAERPCPAQTLSSVARQTLADGGLRAWPFASSPS